MTGVGAAPVWGAIEVGLLEEGSVLCEDLIGLRNEPYLQLVAVESFE